MITKAGPRVRNTQIAEECQITMNIQEEIQKISSHFYRNQILHLTELDDVKLYTNDSAPFKIKTKMPYYLIT